MNKDNIYEWEREEKRNRYIGYFINGEIEINDYMNIIQIIGRRINSMALPREGVYTDITLLIPKLIYGVDLKESVNTLCKIEEEYIEERSILIKTENKLEYIYTNERNLCIELEIEVEERDKELYCKRKRIYISCEIYREGKVSAIYEILSQILEKESYIHIDNDIKPEEKELIKELIDIEEKRIVEVYYPIHPKYIENNIYRESLKGIDLVHGKESKYPRPNWVKDILEILEEEEEIIKRIKNMGYRNISEEEFIETIKNIDIGVIIDKSYINQMDIETYEKEGYWIKISKDKEMHLIITLRPEMYTTTHKRYKYINTKRERIMNMKENLRDIESISLREIEIKNLESLIKV